MDTYGDTPYIESKPNNTHNEAVKLETEKTVVSFTEDDKIAAQRHAMNLLFGGSLQEPQLKTESAEVVNILLWWYLSAEEPYDPRTPLEIFRESCIKVGQEEVDYWEGDEKRLESVLRGTYGMLSDPNIDETVAGVMVGAWTQFVGMFKTENPELQDAEPVTVILHGLALILNNTSIVLAMTKSWKQAKLAELTNTPGINTSTKKWPKALITAVSVAVSVGLIAGAAYFFQKKWRK